MYLVNTIEWQIGLCSCQCLILFPWNTIQQFFLGDCTLPSTWPPITIHDYMLNVHFNRDDRIFNVYILVYVWYRFSLFSVIYLFFCCCRSCCLPWKYKRDDCLYLQIELSNRILSCMFQMYIYFFLIIHSTNSCFLFAFFFFFILFCSFLF